MVFYTCSGCGESLKKNKVENHLYTCKYCEYLTCIDCSKDFYGDDYKTHTSCITEDQKYSAKGTEFKPNKGDLKQQQWLERIDQVITSKDSSLSKRAKELLANIKQYDNIPRKRAKFLNFLKNSLRIFDVKLGEEVWEAFSSASSKAGDNSASAAQKNGTTDIKMVKAVEAKHGEEGMEKKDEKCTKPEHPKAEKRKTETGASSELKKKKRKKEAGSNDAKEAKSAEGMSEQEPTKKKKKKVKDKKQPDEGAINSEEEKQEKGKKRKLSEFNNNHATPETENSETRKRKKKKKKLAEGNTNVTNDEDNKNLEKSKDSSATVGNDTWYVDKTPENMAKTESQAVHLNGVAKMKSKSEKTLGDENGSSGEIKKKKKLKLEKTQDEIGSNLSNDQPAADTTTEGSVKRRKKKSKKAKHNQESLESPENDEVNLKKTNAMDGCPDSEVTANVTTHKPCSDNDKPMKKKKKSKKKKVDTS